MLINSSSIESILLAETRLAADERLSEIGYGIAWTADAFTVERYRYVCMSAYVGRNLLYA